ncbi:MAG: M48 family metallopeptidase [Opitutales bacterium]|nr:M48 family metallopeptidase [Opitutales bacterium]MCH8539366.1 M48 family metallopeptidase [Opitutales bacterium]
MNVLTYGKKTVPYTVTRRERSSLEITVYPDSRVQVVAPLDASEEAIQYRIKRRLKWITRQQRGFENFYPKRSPREYVSGESWLYLGRQYRLKIRVGDAPPKVTLRRPLLEVNIPDPDDRAGVQKALHKWYRHRAQDRLTARYAICAKEMTAFGIEAPSMRLHAMTKRWGSYTPSGNILLNPELVKAPTECIDYVILHELCHVKHPAHNKDFYKLLNRTVPDWLRLKYRLEHTNL